MFIRKVYNPRNVTVLMEPSIHVGYSLRIVDSDGVEQSGSGYTYTTNARRVERKARKFITRYNRVMDLGSRTFTAGDGA